jgi:putative hemolysin
LLAWVTLVGPNDNWRRASHLLLVPDISHRPTEEPLFELAIVLVLVMLNGAFALSELALVSARRPRLRAMADAGRPGARAALAVVDDPGRFLSTVQVGITLVGVLAGAFSGSALGGQVSAWLASLGVPAAVAEPLGFGAVISLVTYLSIVVGELVPKRLALRNPESLACRVAPLMSVVSSIASPIVWLLDSSSNLMFRLLGLGDEVEKGRLIHELGPVIGAVGEQVLEPGPPPADRIQDRLGTGAVRDPGRDQVHHQQAPIGVHGDMALPPDHLLAPSKLRSAPGAAP